MSALTLVVAAAPSVVLLGYFYVRDRHDREPLGAVAVAFVLGAYAMLAAQNLADLAEDWLPGGWLRTGGEPARLFDALVLSGLIEELAKWLLLVCAIARWRAFDEPLDGVVYGVALALGFATLENLLYLERLGLGIAWKRAIFAVPAHALFGGAMGFYAARSHFSSGLGRAHPRDLLLALLVPTAFHGAYDFALFHGLGPAVWVAVAAISIALWAFVLRGVRQAERASPHRPRTIPPPGLLK
jgi:RsiW-degrading membrane proteinase PrsW (M82 family)